MAQKFRVLLERLKSLETLREEEIDGVEVNANGLIESSEGGSQERKYVRQPDF